MNSKINVLILCDKLSVSGSSINGVGRLFSWWIPRFNKNRFNVKLVTLRGNDPGARSLIDNGINIELLGRRKFDPRTIIDIVKICKREKIHVLHLHGYGATNFGRIAAQMVGVKAVIHEHFVDPYMPSYQKIVDSLLRRFNDYGIAVADTVKDFMVYERKFPQAIVETVYNGAPLADFQISNAGLIAAAKLELSIDNNAPVIGTICRLDEQKGLKYFLSAAHKVLTVKPEAKFVIVGDGPLLEDLRGQATRQGISDSVIFAGFKKDVRPIQSAFDVQVFSSLYEGTPLTVFEAMAMERAIVSTRADGLKEVLSDYQNALLVNSGDGDALAKAILLILDDQALAKNLAVQAKHDSVNYDIQQCVDRLQIIFHDVIKK